MRNNAKWDKRDNKDIRQTANSNQEVLTMTRYDERYDEFGYEREDYDGTVQLNEYLTPREVMELLAIGKYSSHGRGSSTLEYAGFACANL